MITCIGGGESCESWELVVSVTCFVRRMPSLVSLCYCMEQRFGAATVDRL